MLPFKGSVSSVDIYAIVCSGGHEARQASLRGAPAVFEWRLVESAGALLLAMRHSQVIALIGVPLERNNKNKKLDLDLFCKLQETAQIDIHVLEL